MKKKPKRLYVQKNSTCKRIVSIKVEYKSIRIAKGMEITFVNFSPLNYKLLTLNYIQALLTINS